MRSLVKRIERLAGCRKRWKTVPARRSTSERTRSSTAFIQTSASLICCGALGSLENSSVAHMYPGPRIWRLTIAAAVLLAGQLAPLQGSRDQIDSASQEQLIAEKDPGASARDKEDVASSDGSRVAWRTPLGGTWRVMVNGQPQGSEFDEVRTVSFSARGERLAYAAKRNGKWVIVADGKQEPGTYDDVGVPTFSDDGRHLAYPVQRAKKWMVVVDGHDHGPALDGIVALKLSADGQRVAYAGRHGGAMLGEKWVVVVDGTEGPSFDIVGGLHFSRDGRRFAHGGVRIKQGFGFQRAEGRVFVDGKPGGSFEGSRTGSIVQGLVTGSTKELVRGYFAELWSPAHSVSAPVFSPDGEHVAYAAQRSKDDAVVFLDDQIGPAFQAIASGPVFSADGRHVAYVAWESGAPVLVVDSKRIGGAQRGFTLVSSPIFAPDESRVAYVGAAGGLWFEEGFTRRARRRVCVDDKTGSEYDALAVTDLTFSQDSRHLAYAVHDAGGSQSFAVVDGQEAKHYDRILPGTMSISGDKTLSYVAQSGRKFVRVTRVL